MSSRVWVCTRVWRWATNDSPFNNHSPKAYADDEKRWKKELYIYTVQTVVRDEKGRQTRQDKTDDLRLRGTIQTIRIIQRAEEWEKKAQETTSYYVRIMTRRDKR